MGVFGKAFRVGEQDVDRHALGGIEVAFVLSGKLGSFGLEDIFDIGIGLFQYSDGAFLKIFGILSGEFFAIGFGGDALCGFGFVFTDGGAGRDEDQGDEDDRKLHLFAPVGYTLNVFKFHFSKDLSF